MAIATGIACTIDAQAADRGSQQDHYDGSYSGESSMPIPREIFGPLAS